MKRYFLLLLAAILLLSGCSSTVEPPVVIPENNVEEEKPRVFTNGEWDLVENLYKENEYNAVNFFVSLSGAIADGVYDDTSAIQAALDKAGNAGGGSVYIAKGKYRITRPINIPDNVTLVGDFVSPTSKKGSSDGTLIIVEPTDVFRDSSVFVLNNNSTLSDLTVWYEEQSFESVAEYPYIVRHASGKSAAVKNIAVLNAYNGITADSSSCEEFLVENVYMTAFNNALRVVACKEKLTVRGFSVSPVYWINDNLTAKPENFDFSAINDIIYNSLTAVTLMGVGDVSMTDVSIDTANVGLLLNISDSTDKTPLFSLLNISNALVPVSVEKLPDAGAAFALCTFGTSNLLNSVAVRVGKDFDSTLSFNSCSFPGQPSVSVRSDGTGRMSFVNCKFVGWRDTALDLSDIIFTAVNSSFNAGSMPVRLGEKSVGMLALCSASALNGEKQEEEIVVPEENEGETEDVIEEEPKKETLFVVSTENEYEFDTLIKSYVGSSASSPDIGSKIFYAEDYGVSTSSPDNSTAIQTAVNHAFTSGGGTVFIPAGQYKINSPILIKEGVSLHGVGSGTDPLISTVLLTEKNAGDAFNFFTLEDSTAIHGVTLYYYNIPDLVSETELLGNAIYAENKKAIHLSDITFVRPSVGISLKGCESVSIDNVSGTTVSKGILLDSCIDIYAEDIDFTAEFATTDALISYRHSNYSAVSAIGGEGITVRDLTCSDADYAVYLDADDVPIVPDEPSFTVLDLFARDVYASAAVNKYPYASFINVASRPTVFSTNAYHLTTFYGNRGKVNLYNLLGSGSVTGGVYARSGTVSVQSSVFNSLGKSALLIDGANVSLIGSMLLDNDCTYHVEASSGGAFLLGNITNNLSTEFGGIETKYIRRYIDDAASYADDGNIRGILPEINS